MSQQTESRTDRWASLRRRAERLVNTSRADVAQMSAADVQTLVHELQLYQTELELQNEELRRTQHELAAARDRFCDLFEHAPVGYLTHDANGTIREANLTAAALLAVDRGSLIGATLADFIARDDQDTWYLHRRRLAETKARQTSEIRARHPQDRTVYVQLESVALDTGGPSAEYRTSLIDATGRRQAEDALRQAHDDLEDRVAARTAGLTAAGQRLEEEIAQRAKAEQRERQLLADLAHAARVHTMGEMASSLAHELNQPLGAMAAEADAARLRLAGDNEQVASPLRASLEFISDQAIRAGQLIRRIRQFAKRVEPQKSPLRLAEVVDEVISLVQSDLRRADVRLAIDLPAQLPTVLADKTQVQQVVLNLVRNALEAIESTTGGPRQLTIQARARPHDLEIVVSDTGGGLPAEHAANPERLFEGFFTTKPDGMGLGLAISRSISEAHGGSLMARQNPDRGATFSFTLAIAEESPNDGR